MHTSIEFLYSECISIESSFSFLDRFRASKRMDKPSIDWTVCSSVQMEAMTSDVIAPSPWKIFGCQNGKT